MTSTEIVYCESNVAEYWYFVNDQSSRGSSIEENKYFINDEDKYITNI